MDPQQSQQAAPNGAWASFYGASFMNQCLHPQLQQLADVQWKLELSAKLAAILEKLREKFAKSQNVCLCQTWVGADGCEAANPNSLEVTLWADPRLAIVLDPLFQELRTKSCQGPVFFRNSMPGKVWRSGAVQIVQNLRILPPTLHPRSQLSEEALERLAEALYIPIYDLSRPSKGQVCVLEVLLSTRATEAMLVADVISFIGSLLSALHLSLANPVQQPVRKSVLCGRRPRAPDSDDEAAACAGGHAQRSQQPQVQRQQPAAGGNQGCQGSTSAPLSAGEQEQHGGREPPPHDANAGSGPPSGLPGKGGVGERPCSVTVNGPVEQGNGAGGSAAGGSRDSQGEMPAAAPATAAPTAVTRLQLPACSEQPTLPASPSHLARGADHAAAAAALAAAGPALGGSCASGSVGIARKVRKLLDGPMQRTKSVVSVAALSDGLAEDDEEDDLAGEGQPGAKAGDFSAKH